MNTSKDLWEIKLSVIKGYVTESTTIFFDDISEYDISKHNISESDNLTDTGYRVNEKTNAITIKKRATISLDYFLYITSDFLSCFSYCRPILTLEKDREGNEVYSLSVISRDMIGKSGLDQIPNTIPLTYINGLLKRDEELSILLGTVYSLESLNTDEKDKIQSFNTDLYDLQIMEGSDILFLTFQVDDDFIYEDVVYYQKEHVKVWGASLGYNLWEDKSIYTTQNVLVTFILSKDK